MQKIGTQKAFLLFTLLFVFLALFSFAAFHETEPLYTEARFCLKMAAPAQDSGMLWEVVFRQFLSLISI